MKWLGKCIGTVGLWGAWAVVCIVHKEAIAAVVPVMVASIVVWVVD